MILISILFTFINCSTYTGVRGPEIPEYKTKNKKTLTVLYASSVGNNSISLQTFHERRLGQTKGSKTLSEAINEIYMLKLKQFGKRAYLKYKEKGTPIKIGTKKYNLKVESVAGYSDNNRKLCEELMKSGLFSSIHYLVGSIYSAKEIKEGVKLKSNQSKVIKQIPVHYHVLSHNNINSVVDYYFDENLLQNIGTDYFLIICSKDLYYEQFSNKEKEKPIDKPQVSCLDMVLFLPHVISIGIIPGGDEHYEEMTYVLISKNNDLLKNKYIGSKSSTISSLLLTPFVSMKNVEFGEGWDARRAHEKNIKLSIVSEIASQVVKKVSEIEMDK